MRWGRKGRCKARSSSINNHIICHGIDFRNIIHRSNIHRSIRSRALKQVFSLTSQSGSTIIEVSIILPLFLIILSTFVYLMLVQYQKTTAERAVRQAARVGTALWYLEYQNPSNNEIYWRFGRNYSLEENNLTDEQKKAVIKMKSGIESELRRGILKPLYTDIQLSFDTDPFTPAALKAEITQVYANPFGGIIGLPKVIKFKASTKGYLTEPVETIRNLDVVEEIVLILADEFGITDKVNTWKENIQNRLTEAKNTLLGKFGFVKNEESESED